MGCGGVGGAAARAAGGDEQSERGRVSATPLGCWCCCGGSLGHRKGIGVAKMQAGSFLPARPARYPLVTAACAVQCCGLQRCESQRRAGMFFECNVP